MKYTKKKVFLRRKQYNTKKKRYANKRKNKTMKGGDIKVVTNKNNNIRKLCIKDENDTTFNPENCWYLFPKNPKWTDEKGQPIDPKKMNLGGIFGSLDSEWKKVISTLDKVAPNRPTTFDNKGFAKMYSPGEAVPVPTIKYSNPSFNPAEVQIEESSL